MRAPADSRDTPKDRRVTVECRVRLPDGAECAGVARAVVRKALADWGLPDLRDDAALAASELAANAFIHGSGPVELYLKLEQGPGVRYALVCEVSDTGPATFRGATGVSQYAESGRGLLIVAAVARSVGMRAGAGCKTVWFRLDVRDTHAAGCRITAGAAT